MGKNSMGYKRFRKTTEYLNECFHRTVKNQKALMNVGRQSGYLKRDKFIKNINYWMNLEKDVPLGFLIAIGAEMDEIFKNLEADKKEFNKFKRQILCGGFVTARSGRKYISIPSTLNDNECIDYVYNQEKHYNFVIYFGSLKMIIVSDKGDIETVFFIPDLKLGKAALLIKGSKGPVSHMSKFDINSVPFKIYL